MKIKSVLSLALAINFSAGVFAQKMELISGSFKALSGQKKVEVVYTFDNMEVGQGKRAMKESDYVSKKKSEYNEKKAGRGDSWEKAWVADRENRFFGKFEELLNKGMSKSGIEFGRNNDDAQYTMIVQTDMTEPGFNIPMVMKQPSLINITVSLVETADQSKVLGKMTLLGATGQTFGYGDWDTGIRIQESYAKAGKSLAAWLPKKGMR
jgi:hypothetical protein